MARVIFAQHVDIVEQKEGLDPSVTVVMRDVLMFECPSYEFSGASFSFDDDGQITTVRQLAEN